MPILNTGVCPGAWKVCPGMGGVDSYSVTLLEAISRGRNGLLGRCNASSVGSPLVHNGKINNPADAVVEIQGRASFTLANSLPRSVNDEFSVRSRVRIVESSDGQFGTSVGLPFAGAISLPTHLARPQFVSGADKFSVARSLEHWNACREHLQSTFGDHANSRGEVKSKS
jgi:hypothetical protein